MSGNIDFTTHFGGTRSVASFGAIEHLNSLLLELEGSSPLLILDSKAQQLFPKVLTSPPSVINFDENSGVVLQELKELLLQKKKDSIVVVSDQNGIDYVKIALYFHLQSKEPAKPLIIIPTTYTTTNTLANEVLYYKRNKKIIECLQHSSLQPRMVIIDERMVNNISAKDKALSVIAIIGGFIDVLHHTPDTSYEYFLALEGISICKEVGYNAIHSPHDSDSRQQILFASHLLSLMRLQLGNGILETMVDILHKVSNVDARLVMNTILPFMMNVVIHGNEQTFHSIATSLGYTSFSDGILKTINSFLEPLPSQLPKRLYDITEEESLTHLLTLHDIEEASHLVFQQKAISTHPSIIDEQDIIRYWEASFWGYPLPEEWA